MKAPRTKTGESAALYPRPSGQPIEKILTKRKGVRDEP